MNQPQPRNPAETYEQFFVLAMFLPWTGILLKHASPQAEERVLDVACGTGIVARHAAPMVGTDGQVVAIDMNAAMLAVARALPAPSGARIEWREGNALALPFPDDDFDLVLCQHGLQLFPERTGAVREMRRVLVTGGRALVIVLQALSRHPVFEALMESVARHLSLPISDVITPFALWDAEELRTLFTLVGFKKTEILAESTMVQFREPNRFVQLAVSSSAAAVPAFADLDAPARALLLDAIRKETEPIVQEYCSAEMVTFPMYAHIAMATKYRS